MQTPIAGALLLAVTVAACDLSTGPDSAGTFDGSVTGEISANLQGSAIFGTVLNGQFSLVMEDPNGPHVLVIEHGDGRPAPGTHDILGFESETGFVAAYARAGEPPAVFLSESGQLQVTTSSSTRLEGSVSFEGVGHSEEDPETELRVTISANFDARCVRTGGSDCR